MFSSITAFFTAISEFFKLKNTKTEKQIEITHLKEHKNIQKACDFAEMAFCYLEKHNAINFDTYKQQRRFDSLVQKFRKYK